MSLLSTILVSIVAATQLPVGSPRNLALKETRSDVLMDDMMLTPEQYEGLLLRKGILSNLWNGTIKYYIDPQFEDKEVDVIYKGLDHWAINSCLQFEEICKKPSSGDFLWFVKQGGCWSYVGNVGFGTRGQKISIGPGCAHLYIVVHEVGHAVGFNHEQTRSDRDDYVTVNFENINVNMSYNYQKESYDGSRGVPYDLYSVMHYKDWYFSTGGKTMVPKNLLGVHIMGQNNEGLSTYDKKLANVMYDCEADLETLCGVSCENFGFLTKGCNCECAPGTSGKKCNETVQDYVDARSDQLLPYTETSGGQYNRNNMTQGILKLHVKAEFSAGDTMQCASIDLGSFANDECDEGYVGVTTRDADQKYCGSNPVPTTGIVSSDWEMKVVVITNQEFSLKVGFVDCSGTA